MVFRNVSIFFSHMLVLINTEMHSIYHVKQNHYPLSSSKICISYWFVKIDKFLAFLGQPHFISSWFSPIAFFTGSLLVCMYTLLWNNNVSLNFAPALPRSDLVATCHTAAWEAYLVLIQCLHGGCLLGEQLWRPGLVPSGSTNTWADLKSTNI